MGREILSDIINTDINPLTIAIPAIIDIVIPRLLKLVLPDNIIEYGFS